jgi:FkbM family methyltransferase
MRDYSITFKGINELKNSFYYSLNSKENKKVILRVYNSYLNYKEYEEVIELVPYIDFWTYIPSNNKNRYVEFRDSETLEIVGLFGLDGVIDIEDFDEFGYVRTIFNNLKPGEKHNVYVVFNELTTQNTYNNDFIKVEENDLVVDIGFNYGLFSMTSLKYKPSKIIAFEPNPNLIKTFTDFFKTSIIEIHQRAVSNKNGKTIFYENMDPGMSTIFQDINTDNIGNSYDVNIISFNDFIVDHKIERIDYLKVDCEGSEYGIFESIPNEYLMNNIGKIAIEFHHKITDIKVQTLINRLKDTGFNIKIIYEENSNIGLIYGKK